MTTNLKSIKTSLLIIFMIGTWSLVSAQTKKIDKAIEQLRYADAAEELNKLIERKNPDVYVFERAGDVYAKLQDYKQAEVFYQRAVGTGSNVPETHIKLAQAFVRNKKRNEALLQIDQYEQKAGSSFLTRLLRKSMEDVSTWTTEPNNFVVTPLSGLNSEYSDFSPFVYGNGVAFVTERDLDLVNETGSGWTNLPFLAVYYSEFSNKDGLSFEEPKPFLTKLSGDFHAGPISIDTAGNLAYFSIVDGLARKGKGSYIESFSAEIVKDKRLKNKTPLPINGKAFSAAHPAISPDGSRLFYATDMEGGSGKMDLYYIDKTDSGWSSPVRLPENINTPLNEVFPYVKSKNVLYFSSDGMGGYGGLDLYETKLIDGQWTDPKNLKAPINSADDDFGICFSKTNSGYFSSNREGTQGKDDIYQFVRFINPTQERVTVAGIFDYAPLPKDGVTLTLLDEFDNVMQTVTSDSNGNFAFDPLPENTKFKIRVEPHPNVNLDSAGLVLVNEQKQPVARLNKLSKGVFAFETLPKEAVAALPLLEEIDRNLMSYELLGQIYSTLPSDEIEGVTMLLLDDEGNVISQVLTDSIGMYRFVKLSKDEHYIVRLAEDDPNMIMAIFMDDGNTIKEITDSNNVFFNLQAALRIPDSARLALKQVPTRGYFIYNDKPVANAKLLAVDLSDQNLNASRTDESGLFDFGLMPERSPFKVILPDSFAFFGGKSKMFLVDRNNKKVMFATRLNRHTYQFHSLSSEIYDGEAPVDPKETYLAPYAVSGKIYEELPGDYGTQRTIRAYDSEGRLIETAVTDEYGNFKFTKLSPDVEYRFDLDDQESGDLNFALVDTDGTIKKLNEINALGEFVFQKLQSERQERFALIEELDGSSIQGASAVAGVIYKTLPGDYKQGTMVFAVDDEGNILDVAFTDASGNFEFKKLNREENFKIKLEDFEDTGLNIAFFDTLGYFDEAVALNDSNEFTYSKVILEAAAELTRSSADLKTYGQVYYYERGDYNKSYRLLALDKDGRLADLSPLTDSGRFVFSKLDPEQTYTFQLEKETSPYNIALTTPSGSLIDIIHRNSRGAFVYDKLKREQYQLSVLEEEDTKFAASQYGTLRLPEGSIKKSEKYTITYKSKQWNIDSSAIPLLERLAFNLKKDRTNVLSVEGHSDAKEFRLKTDYGALRSAAIAGYMREKGVKRKQLFVRNYEGSNPFAECPEGEPCPEEILAQNRRTVLSLEDLSWLPPEPDDVIFYEFSAWTLPVEGVVILRKLIEQMRADSTLKVKIDAYTDSWGNYTNNARISELRAKNIQNFLKLNDIEEDRIAVEWYGESIPLGDCIYDYPCPMDERKKNRRSEIRILRKPLDN